MADNTYTAKLLVKTGVATSTFEDWVDLTNDIASDMASTVVTVGSTTGNVAVVGAVSANTIKVDAISGWTDGTVEVTANVEFTGTSVTLPAVSMDSLDPTGAALAIGGDVDVQGELTANVASFDALSVLGSFSAGTLTTGGNAVFHDGYHPNADTLTTARTISLGGDVSGSAAFDGSSNVTITATIADDSHAHVISNVDGLQTALDGKAALAGSGSQAFSASTLNATIVDLGNWTVREIGGVLYFATGGVNKMKLDASGNLTVVGNITAYGSV